MEKIYHSKTLNKNTPFSLKMEGSVNSFQSDLELSLEEIEHKLREEHKDLFFENITHEFGKNKIVTTGFYTETEYIGDDKKEIEAYSFDGDMDCYSVIYSNGEFHTVINYIERDEFKNLYNFEEAKELNLEEFDKLCKSEKIKFDKDSFKEAVREMLEEYGYNYDDEAVNNILDNQSLKDTFLSECGESITDTAPRETILQYGKY